MKTIGLIGGISWESSLSYYRIINETVKARLGGFHSAKSLMLSVDFAEVEAMQTAGRWDDATQLMVDAARQLEQGGADFLVICANTMHKMADEVQASVNIPLLHIGDATAQAIKAQKLSRVGLLGTRYTMEQDFYRKRLEDRHQIGVIIPPTTDRDVVHRVIFEELVLGVVNPASRQHYKAVINHLVSGGAQGIVLGCTELSLLVKEEDSPVPIFDTTYLHAVAAVEYAIGEVAAL